MTEDKHHQYRKKISSSQIIGSRGEMFVAFILSQFCLVRPVANGTDVGIDLYCEALIDGVPHSHFWVQVKTRKKRVDKSRSFEIKELEYWARQPIPVFIFLASEEAMGIPKFHINVINLTEDFIQQPRIDPNSTKRRKLQANLSIVSIENLKEFIFNHVPETIARLFLRDGVIFQVKQTVHEQYIKNYKFAGASKFSQQLMKNIGRTASLLLRDILNQPGDEFKQERFQLERILDSYHKWGNYDFHYTNGLSKLRNREYELAKICFQRALSNIESDKRLTYAETSFTRNLIFAYIEQCDRKIK